MLKTNFLYISKVANDQIKGQRNFNISGFVMGGNYNILGLGLGNAEPT